MTGERSPRPYGNGSAAEDEDAQVKELALWLIDESTRIGYSLPILVAALAAIVGAVAAAMGDEVRTEFYDRFLAAAGSAETRNIRAVHAWRVGH